MGLVISLGLCRSAGLFGVSPVAGIGLVPGLSDAFSRCNGAIFVGCPDGYARSKHYQSWRLRSKSVALGCSPGWIQTVRPPSHGPGFEIYWGVLFGLSVALMQTCGIVILLTLLRLLSWHVGGRWSRCLFGAGRPRTAGVFKAMAMYGSIASPACQIECLPWRVERPSKPKRSRGQGVKASWPRLGWVWFWLLGGSLPRIIFAAPVEVRLAAAIEGWCATLPQQLPAPLGADVRTTPGEAVAASEDPPAPSTNLTCVVFETGQVASRVVVSVTGDLASGKVLAAVSDAMLPPAFPFSLVPAVPSFGRGYLPLVTVYDWVSAASKTTFVANFEACGGPIFAICDWEFVSHRTLASLAARFLLGEWQVFFGTSPTPMAPEDSVLAFHGVVFTFVRPGIGRPPAPLFEDRLRRAAGAGPAEGAEVYQDRQSDKWLLLCSHVTRLIGGTGQDFAGVRASVADAIPAFADEILVSEAPLASPFMKVNCEGLWVKGVLAATPKPPDTPCVSMTGGLRFGGRQVSRASSCCHFRASGMECRRGSRRRGLPTSATRL